MAVLLSRTVHVSVQYHCTEHSTASSGPAGQSVRRSALCVSTNTTVTSYRIISEDSKQIIKYQPKYHCVLSVRVISDVELLWILQKSRRKVCSEYEV